MKRSPDGLVRLVNMKETNPDVIQQLAQAIQGIQETLRQRLTNDASSFDVDAAMEFFSSKKD